MRFSLATTLLALSSAASAAAQWGFVDGSVTVAAKGGEGITEKFTSAAKAKTEVALGHVSTLKLSLTAEEAGKAKRPHQAFLVLRETASGLEAPFPLTIKESGKGTVKLTQKDLPIQLLNSATPLEAKIVLGSFGSSKAIVASVFDINVVRDPSHVNTYEAPLRYGKRPEIHHIFRADPKNPPKVISLVFAGAVLAAIPVLFISWLALGANLSHASKALGAAPVSHAVFYGSIVAMEGVFFLYYSTWNLFQTLPAIVIVGIVAFLSGNSALGEVQRRRLAGER
ncbi:oligosaccharyltransferase subunit ribophorin II [Beauveria bassiana ARSEF 2860]|uniref:Oligosaccharyltransferase subunit ribophorin II n=1 Tax=Beauveria bassiana (strain ARSEF 2860) TaxID=655819 RepID=J5JKB7_BEAB2|nr:oligosaccharyltransferase subunit ribophorin II [Beauveria bassiana ARSEF 2860]EJP65873.1 oligosaccharyltransferase subunit ribophorin II [Beauveria bassiana ARSEF 2860]